MCIYVFIDCDLICGYFINIFKNIFQWKALTDGEKTIYEEKAKILNVENAAKAAEEKKLEEQ